MPWQDEYSKMCSAYHRILDRVAETRDVAEKNAIREEAKVQHNKLQAFRVHHASMDGTQQAEIPETVMKPLIPGHTKAHNALKRTYERESNV